MHEELAAAIRDGQAILFVGSGASAGLGAPTWSGLIAEIGRQLGYDADVFASLGASYLTVAEFYKIKKGGIGPLRSWMDNNWAVSDDVLSKSILHNLIVKLDFSVIYTTNYDRNLENSFKINNKDYKKISNISHLADPSPGTQIIKLHGDFDDDNSIVITESDYFKRLDFTSALDLKLRSDVLGKTILFIGYSLSDINVRLLLYKLWEIWQLSGRESERPRSYLFLTRPDEIQETVLRQWGVDTITADVDDPGAATCAFLESLLDQVSKLR